MANRNQKIAYIFIYDDAKHFYRASQSFNGTWTVSHDAQMYPLKNNPKNLKENPVEFATNKTYFSMNRSINYPLEFILDGAAILNSRYILGKGISENLYIAIFEFDDTDGKYKLSYNGRFDFQQKKRDEKISTFTVPVVDDSAWGILSQTDDVEYAIDCSQSNPKSIKVLIDNFTLNNRFTFQSVQAPINSNFAANDIFADFTIPFVLVNQDGDSFGLVVKNQVGDRTQDVNYPVNSLNYFLYTYYPVTEVNIQGIFVWTWNMPAGAPYAGVEIFFKSSTGQTHQIFIAPANGGLILGQTYSINYNFSWDLVAGEKIFFFMRLRAGLGKHNIIVTPITSNTFITVNTKAENTIVYGRRPLDVVQEIVQRATFQRYDIGSNFFEDNNKTVLVPGEGFRGVPDAKIYTSFKDFFESFSALFFMALRVVNGSLFMELADEVYKQGSNLIDLGELIECKTYPAVDFIPNEVEVGSPNQDYRHPSGRLEFNAPLRFSLPFTNVKNKLPLVGKYRRDCYGMIFLILDYKGSSTQDNSGDKDVFIVDITDEQGAALENIETFENFTVNNAPLAPIIKYPITGDIIYNDKPLLKGIGIPGTNVNIFIFDVLDGNTTVDVNGNWTYQIVTSLPSYNPGVFDGISVINASNTTILGALDTIQLIIDTTIASPTGITYPRANDSLYNNLPLIKGVAPDGTNIDIFLDGVLLASVVADNSCKFEYKVISPLTNGVHTLQVGAQLVSITVDSFTAFPIITYIGSELDGFIIVNNLPLIKGVGIPGTVVTIWLNYISYGALGTAIVDINGDWSFQVIPIDYIDPLSGLPVVLAPIRNGLSVLSTLLINNSVLVNVSGFKLNRPAYDSITGVPDNTVFNTRLSSKRAFLNHKSLFASIMNKQQGDSIIFQTSPKNSTLRTVLGSEVIQESANVPYSSLGNPLLLLEYADIKCISRRRFNDILEDFNSGGTITATFKGNTLYFLPIGRMKMKSILDDVEEWKLLFSPLTSYFTLLNLYKSGVTINLMDNAFFHSDANSLHGVEYNFTMSDKYNFKTIYDDWWVNRNDAWSEDPQYIQKYQKTEIVRDQIINKGVASLTLRMYKCSNGALVDSKNYEPASPAPIPLPEIVLEAVYDFNDYPEGQYFFVAFSGDTPCMIFERIEIKTKWKKTILIESFNSVNKPGVFYSTGFKTILRVEGLVKKLQPDIEVVGATEESGNSSTLYAQLKKKRVIRYGTAKGLPDFLAIKVADAIIQDSCSVEGVLYVIDPEDKMAPSEDIPGVPLYYYNVNMLLQDNSKGRVFPGGDGAERNGVVITVDARSIGIPTDVIIDISED